MSVSCQKPGDVATFPKHFWLAVAIGVTLWALLSFGTAIS